MSVYDVYKDYIAQPSTYGKQTGSIAANLPFEKTGGHMTSKYRTDYVAPPSTYTQAYGNNNQLPPPPQQQQGSPVSQGVGAHYAPAPTPIWNPQTQQWQLPGGETPQTMSTMPVANPEAIGAHYTPSPAPQFNQDLMRWEGEGEKTMNTMPEDAAYSEDERLRFGQSGWLRQQMTDDKGVFRGGDEGRVFGRMRDWWEDKVMGGGNPSNREDGLVVSDDFK